MSVQTVRVPAVQRLAEGERCAFRSSARARNSRGSPCCGTRRAGSPTSTTARTGTSIWTSASVTSTTPRTIAYFAAITGRRSLPTTGFCDFGPCAGWSLERFELSLDGEDALVAIPDAASPRATPMNFVLIGGLSAALAVAFGAFGAHGLKKFASPEQLRWWGDRLALSPRRRARDRAVRPPALAEAGRSRRWSVPHARDTALLRLSLRDDARRSALVRRRDTARRHRDHRGSRPPRARGTLSARSRESTAERCASSGCGAPRCVRARARFVSPRPKNERGEPPTYRVVAAVSLRGTNEGAPARRMNRWPGPRP